MLDSKSDDEMPLSAGATAFKSTSSFEMPNMAGNRGRKGSDASSQGSQYTALVSDGSMFSLQGKGSDRTMDIRFTQESGDDGNFEKDERLQVPVAAREAEHLMPPPSQGSRGKLVVPVAAPAQTKSGDRASVFERIKPLNLKSANPQLNSRLALIDQQLEDVNQMTDHLMIDQQRIQSYHPQS